MVHEGKIVFAQLMDHLPLHSFRRCVERFAGDRSVRSFSCQDQFRCMAFGQLTYRDSLRDTVTCLNAQQAKLYHMGIRGSVRRSTLADANERRDWRLYAAFAQVLIAQARGLYARDTFGADLDATAYALDTHHHRSVPVAVPLGEVPPQQGRGEAARHDRPARQHPRGYPYRRR